jgi:hypothetical protein
MIAIDDKLISEDIISTHFVCHLTACKGACCVQGDAGAPLEADELPILAHIYESVKPYLTEQGIEAIEKQGLYVVDNETDGGYATPLINGAACVYIVFDEDNIAGCGIQKAYNEGKINWQKPISCHLYPIRIKRYSDFEAVNYDKWHICKAACKFGKSQKVKLYEFLREPLIRKYGNDFYEQLHAAAQHLNDPPSELNTP